MTTFKKSEGLTLKYRFLASFEGRLLYIGIRSLVGQDSPFCLITDWVTFLCLAPLGIWVFDPCFSTSHLQNCFVSVSHSVKTLEVHARRKFYPYFASIGKLKQKGFFFSVWRFNLVVFQSCKGTIFSFVAYFLSIQSSTFSHFKLFCWCGSVVVNMFWHSGLFGK